MRTIFFGTPEIAVPALVALAETTEVVAVVCQPDRPAGRGLVERSPAIKVKATELGIAVHQPTKIKTPEFAAMVRDWAADVGVVMAYGRILPPAVLDAPRRGMMNLHASLLPKYRGAAPINWAIVDGETKTGVALMQMDEGLDTGPVYAMREVAIGPDDTAEVVAERLASYAALVVREDLPRAVNGELVATAQDAARATHARILTKDDGLVPFGLSAERVHDHVRGMSPWPGAFAFIGAGAARKTFKVLRTERVESSGASASEAPGTVVIAARGRIEVACGSGRVAILRGQLEGRKPLDAAELVGGRTLQEGMVLSGRT
ncbi:MAG: methionyl-tRNA formyltransferase [Polyangiaceae bacterium]